ncbi:MAG: tetratricopeptide repeat protein [Candidatus Eisenbacteria bacterium]|uniref:Tetratricopeptide repeat protein n=1 Tax=Eiseniibacteriota bacterium TaxID=2212470 RepID=A0A7Y2H3V9_UNCEI|nr:tetratricopeptide repeat protein [Candidatus Eisenbacteria bacterium]
MDLVNNNPNCLSLEALASVVEGSSLTDRERKHLAVCPVCAAALESIPQPANLSSTPRAPEAYETLGIGLGKTLRNRPRKRPYLNLGLGVAAALFVALLSVGRLQPAPETLELSQALIVTIENFSASEMILPAGVTAADRQELRTRGIQFFDAKLQTEIVALENQCRSDRREPCSVALASVYIASGQMRRANTLLRSAVDEFPQNTDLRMLHAMSVLYTGHPDSAAAELSLLAEEEPKAALIQLNLGLALAKSGRHGEAQDVLQPLASKHPSTPLGRRAALELEVIRGA